MSSAIQPARTVSSLWFQAIRPFSLTASVIPVLFGAMYTLTYYSGPVNWYLFILIFLGSPFFQIAGNLFSEYYDFKHKVDRPETFGGSKILVDKLMKPSTVIAGALFSLFVLAVVGSVLVYFRGTEMLLLGLIGIAATYAYTFSKFHSMGDFHIYIFFGPLMIFGTNYALTGSNELFWTLMLVSIPIAFLVTAILHANNTRDIMHDGQANIRTFAGLIGLKASQIYYYGLLLGSYLAVVLFIIFNLLPIWTLLVFITLPIALKHNKMMSTAKVDSPTNIQMLDVLTAQLHLVFGFLLSIGTLIGYFVKW